MRMPNTKFQQSMLYLYGIFKYIIYGIIASVYHWRTRRKPQLGISKNDERLHIQNFQYSRAM